MQIQSQAEEPLSEEEKIQQAYLSSLKCRENDWITIKMRLVQAERKVSVPVKAVKWSTEVRTTKTTVGSLYRAILHRHGLIKDIRLFLQPDAQNPLRDVRLSLADLGFEGGRRADRQSGTMYYSFELAPAAQDDPIMLFEPTSLTLKTFADLDQAEWARAEETRKKAGDAAVGSGEQPEN
eukprot:248660_1